MLLKVLRAGGLLLGEALAILEHADALFGPRTIPVNSAEALKLAHAHGCSSYDAELVLLAQRLACPLLTFDRKLLEPVRRQFRKLSVFIAVRTVEVAGIIVPLVIEANRAAIVREGPDLLDQLVVEFFRQLPTEEGKRISLGRE